ncbi:MAG: OadG family protein [Methylococcales bacterium]|nr:OadG family protein [Methylococcales bacterium]
MDEMMGSGIELMLIGMGIVFGFLALLIVMVNLMTRIIHRYFPDDPLSDMSAVLASTTHTSANVIAAITAAVHRYRNKDK